MFANSTLYYASTTSKFPSGLSKADVFWNYHGTEYKMEFYAGFVGVKQNRETLALRPEINWVIVDAGTPNEKEMEEIEKATENTPELKDPEFWKEKEEEKK